MEEDGEAFDINDRDLEFALDPTRRRGRNQTKEQQLYGVFYEGDDDDNRPGFGLSATAKVSKGISFVSGGSAGKTDEDETILPAKKPRIEKFTSRNNSQQAFAGMRSPAGPEWVQKSDKGSVIMNMMKQMGYVEGKGLGANKQGRTEVIEAAVRPGRATIGAYGREVNSVGPKTSDKNDASTAPEEEEYVPRKGGWKKDKKKQQKSQIRTLDDVIAGTGDETGEGGGSVTCTSTATTSVKIIDMTGPQQKVYSDFHTYSKKTRAAGLEVEERKKFDIPALTQNISLLVDVTEEEIRRNDKQIKSMKDQNKSLEADCQNIKKFIVDERKEVDRLQEVLSLIELFEAPENQNLTACKGLLLRLRNEFVVEYKLYGLDSIALTTAMPMLKQHFKSWDPLKLGQVDYGIDLIEEWKSVLEGEGKEKKHMFDRLKSEMDALPAFDRCLWEAWMPPVRQAIFRWNVKGNSSAMLDLVLTWKLILPDWIIDNLLEQIIIPRISEQVDRWDPTTDEIPIDSWLVPWHRVLGDRLMLVYPTVRQKLARALKDWVPLDSSALTVLRPWKEVFRKDTMNSFLMTNIVPKLEQTLYSMDLTPNYNVPAFAAVVGWTEMVGLDLMSRMMQTCFFPRWLEYLYGWLTSPGIILNEVAKYYKEWRDRFPAVLASLAVIKAEFQRGLNLISQAKQNIPIQLATAPPLVRNEPIPPRQFFVPQSTPLQNMHRTSLKEFVQMRAQNLGIIFMPVPNRQEQSKPVYQLGNIQILFDRDLLVVYNPHNRQWEPTNVDYAFEMAGSA